MIWNSLHLISNQFFISLGYGTLGRLLRRYGSLRDVSRNNEWCDLPWSQEVARSQVLSYDWLLLVYPKLKSILHCCTNTHPIFAILHKYYEYSTRKNELTWDLTNDSLDPSTKPRAWWTAALLLNVMLCKLKLLSNILETTSVQLSRRACVTSRAAMVR